MNYKDTAEFRIAFIFNNKVHEENHKGFLRFLEFLKSVFLFNVNARNSTSQNSNPKFCIIPIHFLNSANQ
jgi:hypothetical protein